MKQSLQSFLHLPTNPAAKPHVKHSDTAPAVRRFTHTHNPDEAVRYQTAHAPIPLSSSRPRPLTPLLDGQSDAHASRHDGEPPRPSSPGGMSYHRQQQSSLFRLPIEIRAMILEHVLGRRSLHILQRFGRLGCLICRKSEGECRGIFDCGNERWQDGGVYSGLVDDVGGEMLRVCRRL